MIVAAEHGFHGRTMGSLALTGKASIREPFGPFGLTVRFVPFGDAAALRAALGPDCAAVFLEPALGEGGVVPAPEGYLRAAREACDEAGALLVVDEIQSAIGRTGAWFAHQAEGVRPDVLTLAKGLGGGLPIGACVGFGRCGAGFAKGDHGSTFGGNPVACAAALAVLDTIERDGLLAQVTAVGERLTAGLRAIRHPLVAGVRGRGLWLAVALTAARAADLEAAARQAGFLVNAVQPDAIRLAPPLILSPGEADEFLAALARHPRLRRPRDAQALPARRRPHSRRAGRGPRPGRRDEEGQVRLPDAGRAARHGRAVRQAVACGPGSPSRSASPNWAATRSSSTPRPLTSAGARPSRTRPGSWPGRWPPSPGGPSRRSGWRRWPAASAVPVINALTDQFHPCQVLADLQTVRAHYGPLAGRTLTFLGDGSSNMAHSYLLGGATAGLRVRIGAPESLHPSPAVLDAAQQIAARTGGAGRGRHGPRSGLPGGRRHRH